MLFKPESEEGAKAAEMRKPGFLSRVLKRMVSLAVTLVILGGLGYIGWYAFQPKPGGGGGGGRGGQRLDLPVPVLAATPRTLDVPVYLDGVGSVRALNNVLVRAQVDGKLIAVNFTEGQDVRKGDVLGIVAQPAADQRGREHGAPERCPANHARASRLTICSGLPALNAARLCSNCCDASITY